MTKPTVRLACLLGIVAAGCSQMTHDQQVEEANLRWSHMRAKVKLQMAERSFQSGNLDEALKQCGEVLGLDPRFADGCILMARIRLERGEMSRADAALDVAESLASNTAEVSYLRGLIAERRNQPEHAVAFYRTAYQVDPDELDYLLTYVESLIGTGRYQEAIETIGPRRVDFERHAEVHALAGQGFWLLGRSAEAANCYRIALSLAPDDDLLREEAGIALLAADRIREALDVLGRLTDSESEKLRPGVLRALAAARLRAGQPIAAAEILEQGLRQYRTDAGLWMMLAEACLRSGDMKRAGTAVNEAVTLAPDQPEAWLLLGYHALAVGKTQNAILAAKRIIEQNANDLEARILLARAAEADPQHLSEAVEQYRGILLIDPDHKWARLRLERFTSKAEADAGEDELELRD